MLSTTVIRLPEELKAALKAQAAQNGRSMNAELVTRLERSLVQQVEPEAYTTNDDLGQPMALLGAMINALEAMYRLASVQTLGTNNVPRDKEEYEDALRWLESQREKLEEFKAPANTASQSRLAND